MTLKERLNKIYTPSYDDIIEGAVISVSETNLKVYLVAIRIPEYLRGKGLGTKLVNKVKSYAKEVRKPLYVQAGGYDETSLVDLYKWYTRLGFKPINKVDWTDPELSSIMLTYNL